MKKIFMILCIVIMFFGIAGCPSDDDQKTLNRSSFTPISSTSTSTSGTIDIQPIPIHENNPGGSAVPEPATLILLGSGLVGLAGFGRKRFKK